MYSGLPFAGPDTTPLSSTQVGTCFNSQEDFGGKIGYFRALSFAFSFLYRYFSHKFKFTEVFAMFAPELWIMDLPLSITQVTEVSIFFTDG